MNGKRPGGWVALAWRCFRDEAMLAVSADAELLYLHALQFAGEGETDGRVPKAALGLLASKLVGSPEAAAGELLAVRLWSETERCYLIRNWDRWQDSAEQRRAARERDAKRKALSRGNADTTGDTPRDSWGESRGAGAGAGAGAGHSPKPPDPSANDFESEDQEPETWEDEHGYLFVGRRPDE